MPCDRPAPTRPQAAKGKNHPMIQRLSKTACVAAMALFASLVAFGNITDYGANLPFVQHVLAMDTIFPDSTIRYRAIHTPWLHHAAYLTIILLERSEEHTSELQSLMRISYAVFCLKKKNNITTT